MCAPVQKTFRSRQPSFCFCSQASIRFLPWSSMSLSNLGARTFSVTTHSHCLSPGVKFLGDCPLEPRVPVYLLWSRSARSCSVQTFPHGKPLTVFVLRCQVPGRLSIATPCPCLPIGARTFAVTTHSPHCLSPGVKFLGDCPLQPRVPV